VTTRRRIRIDVELPELTPAQADFLWTFLDDLAADLWDAYEPELLDIENEHSRPPKIDTDSTGGDWPADDGEGVPAGTDAQLEPCPFRSLHASGFCPTCGRNFTSAARHPANDEPDPEF